MLLSWSVNVVCVGTLVLCMHDPVDHILAVTNRIAVFQLDQNRGALRSALFSLPLHPSALSTLPLRPSALLAFHAVHESQTCTLVLSTRDIVSKLVQLISN